MKNPLLILSCILFSFSLSAQEDTSQKEIGITFKNLDGFGLSFKKGTAKSLWRFNSAVTSGALSERSQDVDLSSNERTDFNFDFSIGKEFRKSINSQFEFRYGVDAGFDFGYLRSNSINSDFSTQTSTSFSYTPGINAVIGFNYILKERFVFGTEILPRIAYETGRSTRKSTNSGVTTTSKSDYAGFYYGFSNNSAVLSISYRF